MERFIKRYENGEIELIGIEDMYRLECCLYPHENKTLYACLNKLADYEDEAEQREQGCEYCNVNEEGTGKELSKKPQEKDCYGLFVLDSSNGDFKIAYNSRREFESAKINFCPVCGKRLQKIMEGRN